MEGYYQINLKNSANYTKWGHVAQDRVHWRALANVVMNIQFPKRPI